MQNIIDIDKQLKQSLQSPQKNSDTKSINSMQESALGGSNLKRFRTLRKKQTKKVSKAEAR